MSTEWKFSRNSNLLILCQYQEELNVMCPSKMIFSKLYWYETRFKSLEKIKTFHGSTLKLESQKMDQTAFCFRWLNEASKWQFHKEIKMSYSSWGLSVCILDATG